MGQRKLGLQRMCAIWALVGGARLSGGLILQGDHIHKLGFVEIFPPHPKRKKEQVELGCSERSILNAERENLESNVMATMKSPPLHHLLATLHPVELGETSTLRLHEQFAARSKLWLRARDRNILLLRGTNTTLKMELKC